MADLTEPQKEAIVLQLARFRKPAEVAVYMREEFGLELELVQITRYDPTKPAYASGEKWRDIFAVARQDYLENVKAVPVANQGWRLQTLQEGIEAARKGKNWKLVAELMEQAAKEVGGVLTNERNVNVSDSRRAREMTSEDRAALLGSIISEALAVKAASQPTKH